MTAIRRLSHTVRRLGHARDEGAATVELVLAIPVLFLLVVMIAQTVTASFGSNAVRAAADRALDVARVEGGTDAAARKAATDMMTVLSGHAVPDVHIRITRTPTRIRVLITARTGRILLFPRHTTAVAAGPIEQLTVPPGGR